MLPAPKSMIVAPGKRMCCCTMEPLLPHLTPSSAEMNDEFILPTEGWRRTADQFIPYYLLAAFFFAESKKLTQLSFV
jgi:hypothetical protein